MFSIKDGSFKRFENGTVKLLAEETKWASLEVRTQHTLLENLVSKCDTGPVKLPGLSRNRPQEGIKARADSREQGERGTVEEEKELDGGPRMICTSQLVGSRVLGLTSMITRRLGDGEGKGKGEYS